MKTLVKTLVKVKSATSAGRSVTLLAVAQKVVAVVVVTTCQVTQVAGLGTVDHQRFPNFALTPPISHAATPAAVLDTLLATAYRVPNATTVLDSYVHRAQIYHPPLKTHSRTRVTSVRIAPSPRDALVTPVALKGLSIPYFFHPLGR